MEKRLVWHLPNLVTSTDSSGREIAEVWPQGYIAPIKWDEVQTANGTCGRNAFAAMSRTTIADVVAGTEVGFRTNSFPEILGLPPGEEADNGPFGYGHFYHPGPGQVHLSRAPNDDLSAYRGEGEWFKIAYAGPLNNTTWKLRGQTDVCCCGYSCNMYSRTDRAP